MTKPEYLTNNLRDLPTETVFTAEEKAASDMLAALKPLAKYLANNGGDTEYHDADGTGWLTRARAAIAAAEAAGIK